MRPAACLKDAFIARNFPEAYDNDAVTIRASPRRAARCRTKKIICPGYRNKRYDRLPVYRGVSFPLFLSVASSASAPLLSSRARCFPPALLVAPHLSSVGGGES